MRRRRRRLPFLVGFVLVVVSVLAPSAASASVQGFKTTIGTTDPDAPPVTTLVVGSDGTVYAPVAVPGEYPYPFVSSGVVKAFHPDGRVEDTAWSFAWPTSEGPGYPLSLGIDGAGNIYGYAVHYDEQVGSSQQVWKLPAGGSAPELLPFDLPDLGPGLYDNLWDPSLHADLVVSDNGDVVVKNLEDSTLWLLRAGETTPVTLPASGFESPLGYSLRDLASTSDGTLYALGDSDQGIGGDRIRRLAAGAEAWEVLPAEYGDPAVGNATRITVDDQGNVFTLGEADGSGVLWRLPDGATPSEQVTTFDAAPSGARFRFQYAEMAMVGHQAVIVAPSGLSSLVSVELQTVTAMASDNYQIVRGSAPLSIDAHDTNGDQLTFQITTGPTNGEVTGDYPDITYTPTPGYLGRDSVSYKVTSPNGTWAIATITISVRKPLVVQGDGWTQTTIYDIDSWDGMVPYGVMVEGDGTVLFPIVKTETGTGALVAQRPDGHRTETSWVIDQWYNDYPLSMDADAEGNLYASVILNDRGDMGIRMRPAGGDTLEPVPFPTVPGGSAWPPSVAVSDVGDVLMSEWMAAKVHVRRAGSSSLTELALPTGFRPIDLDIGPDETVYIIGYEPGQYRSQIVRMSLDGTATEIIPVNGVGHGIAVADDGTIYITGAEQSASSYAVLRLGVGGHLERVSGPIDIYNSWNSLEVDGNGSVYVSEIWGTRLMRIDFAASNTAPIAADSTRSVRGNQSSGLALSATDPDGDDVTYSVTGGPTRGSLTGEAPDLIYTPEEGYTGPDSVSYLVDDGNGGSASATVLITVTDPETGVASVSQPAVEGQTVATGAEPTVDEPTQAAVTTPVAGDVTITQDPSVADPSGYSVVGAQYQIEAPPATAEAPLRLRFQVAADQLPAGQDAADLVVFRDGVAIDDCADDSGTAVPDPCVVSRTTAGGVITATVLSSHASGWTLAVKQLPTATTMSPAEPSVYGQAVSLTATVAQAGSAKPTGSVEFRDTSVSPARVLGSAPVVADGTARLDGIRLDAGEHAVEATYSGSVTSLPSVSAPITASVAKAPVVVTTNATSGLLSVLTFKITYRTTVTSAVTGELVAGVSVTTRINGGSATTGCTAVTNGNGVATCKAGPINVALGARFTATTAETLNHESGTATAKMPLV